MNQGPKKGPCSTRLKHSGAENTPYRPPTFKKLSLTHTFRVGSSDSSQDNNAGEVGRALLPVTMLHSSENIMTKVRNERVNCEFERQSAAQ